METPAHITLELEKMRKREIAAMVLAERAACEALAWAAYEKSREPVAREVAEAIAARNAANRR